MAKLFGIGATDAKKPQHIHHDDHTHDHESSTDHSDHEIDVEIREERDHEGDIGQIAVDVLDLAEELIIVAPVA